MYFASANLVRTLPGMFHTWSCRYKQEQELPKLIFHPLLNFYTPRPLTTNNENESHVKAPKMATDPKLSKHLLGATMYGITGRYDVACLEKAVYSSLCPKTNQEHVHLHRSPPRLAQSATRQIRMQLSAIQTTPQMHSR